MRAVAEQALSNEGRSVGRIPSLAVVDPLATRNRSPIEHGGRKLNSAAPTFSAKVLRTERGGKVRVYPASLTKKGRTLQ